MLDHDLDGIRLAGEVPLHVFDALNRLERLRLVLETFEGQVEARHREGQSQQHDQRDPAIDEGSSHDAHGKPVPGAHPGTSPGTRLRVSLRQQ
jgi:hypothetical protein